MIDLHTHILPGLDDGAEDLSEALAMAELAVEGGVDTLAATPHSNQAGRFENYASPQLVQVFQRFQQALRRAGIPLRVYLGMEIFASEDMGEKIRRRMLFGINQSRYHLVEFPFDQDPAGIREGLDQIFAAGGVPLIAHPERYFCVQDYPQLVYDWVQQGCCTQLNKGSVFGRFGRGAARAAEVLLQHQLVTCVSSDAHSSYLRTTYMEDARAYLEDQFGAGEAHRMLVENPDRILRDLPIPAHGWPPERMGRRAP